MKSYLHGHVIKHRQLVLLRFQGLLTFKLASAEMLSNVSNPDCFALG